MIKCLVLSNIDKKEIEDRKNYMYKVFPTIYRIEVIKCDNYVEIKGYTVNSIDILILIGHNLSVYKALKKINYEISKLLIISCNINKAMIKELDNIKEIYYSKMEDNKTYFYKKELYGFDFDITESELLLYNIKGNSLNEVIDEAFDRIK